MAVKSLPQSISNIVTEHAWEGIPAKAPRQLLTVNEVLAELGVPRSTFYDWRAKRRAPRCIKLPNGDLRVRRADLDRWLEQREVA